MFLIAPNAVNYTKNFLKFPIDFSKKYEILFARSFEKGFSGRYSSNDATSGCH